MRSNLPVREDFATFTPLKIALAYLAFTFAIAVAGPVVYVDFSRGRTALFLLAVSIALTVGYTMGVRSMVHHGDSGQSVSVKKTSALFHVSLVAAILALASSVWAALNSGSLNTDLTGLGDAYIDAYDGYVRNSGGYSLSFLLYSMSLPFSFIASIWGIFYFNMLDKRRRILIILLVVGGLLFYVVGTGKQKQVGDILIYLVAIGAIKYGAAGKPLSVKLIGQAIIGAIVAIALFVAVLSQRYAAVNVGAFNINEHVHPRMSFDIEHPVFKFLGMDYGFGLSMFSTYLSQGYYGLSLALNTDWAWTKMSGFSYSLSVIFNRFLGFEWEWPNTLVYRVGATTGWGESKWHTVFPYFASDFTWLGAIVLFGLLAYIYARSWLLSIRQNNPYAILMFTLITMGVFFMPANNQLFHSPGLLFTVIVVSFLYIRDGHVSGNAGQGIVSSKPVAKGCAIASRT